MSAFAAPKSRFIIVVSMAKVLIVEDDDVIAQGMASHLTSAGFDPVSASHGERRDSPGCGSRIPRSASST